MNPRVFFLIQRGKAERTTVLPDLKNGLAEEATGSVSLELRKGLPPKPWEKFIYPLFGLKIPIASTRLTIYWANALSLATFEDNDQEWVAVGNGESSGKVIVNFRTDAGELFPVQACDCIPKEQGFRLLEDFFHSQKRPTTTKWIKSGTQRLKR